MRSRRRDIRQISEIANAMLDPVLSRRAGINTMLLGSWDEIAGEDFAGCTRPEAIRWDRQDREQVAQGGFNPGVLVVACEGARALFLMHAKDELIARINAFFGYVAVNRLRIVQKPVHQAPPRRGVGPLARRDAERLDGMLGEVEDPRLRASLERLGRAVLSTRGGAVRRDG